MQKNLVQVIHFSDDYFESTTLSENHDTFISAISFLLAGEKLYCKNLEIIWVNDNYLRQLHIKYLNNSNYTDVMTFNYAEENTIDGEVYISIDRAKANSGLYHVSLENELARLIIHGLLHISGYKDHTNEEKKKMRFKENVYLKRSFLF